MCVQTHLAAPQRCAGSLCPSCPPRRAGSCGGEIRSGYSKRPLTLWGLCLCWVEPKKRAVAVLQMCSGIQVKEDQATLGPPLRSLPFACISIATPPSLQLLHAQGTQQKPRLLQFGRALNYVSRIFNIQALQGPARPAKLLAAPLPQCTMSAVATAAADVPARKLPLAAGLHHEAGAEWRECGLDCRGAAHEALRRSPRSVGYISESQRAQSGLIKQYTLRYIL